MQLRTNSQRGVGLIELMVTLVIGMLIVAAAIAINTSTLGANSWHIKASKLNMELARIMTLVGNDLRRGGFTDVVSVTSMPSAVTFVDTSPSSIGVRYELNATDTAATQYVYDLADGQLSITIGTGLANKLNDVNLLKVTDFTITELARDAACNAEEGLRVTPRVFVIELSGELAKDAGTSRSLRQTVRVRNDTTEAVAGC